MLRVSLAYVALVGAMAVLWIGSIQAAMKFAGYGADSPQDPATASRLFLIMLLVCAVNTGVVAYTIVRSRWHGFRLVAVMVLQIFGIQFFISQMETLYFNYGVKMPQTLIAAIVIAGFSLAVIFSFLAVLVLGKMKKDSAAEVQSKRLVMPGKEFAIKFVLLAAVVYPVIYFLAGYFIAWQFDDVRMFYSGSTHLAGFGAQLQEAYLESSLYPYQVLRGGLWILIALPVIRMLKGGVWEAGTVVALLFSCLMCLQLLLPNPYMPGMVAFAHFIETFSSNALWGLAVVWLLHGHHTSARALLHR